MAKQVLIVTIVTNGVSFSLVAGACVAVYFSNGLSGTPTLNVNSTGAKNLRPISKDRTYWEDNTLYSTTHVWASLIFYTGSMYYACDSYRYRYYSDSDS